MEIYTIGFTKKTAAQFFGSIKQAGIKRLLDVRLNNSSQLSAFAKKEDLAYFLQVICNAEYVHLPLLAPSQDMLDRYKKQKGSWTEYEGRFIELMKTRRIEENLDKGLFEVPCVLLCSEATAEHCHRRLVVEYLQQRWGSVTARHL
ncbi:MAG TPA: DUF488 domain-containing protein [Planktothrix sp.]|jgi:uncharacterized protein (DUF488 family)